MSSSQRPLLFLAVVVAAGIFGPSASSAAAGGGPQHFALHAAGKDVDAVRNAGATAVRVIKQWYEMEPAPGGLDFQLLDKVVEQLSSAGIEVVVTLRCNSNWACEQQVSPAGGKGNCGKMSSAPKDMADWSRFLKQVVERYDGDGDGDMPGLRAPVRYWQIENEFMSQWKGTDQQLAEVLRAAYEAIKAADPHARVIGPGLNALHLLSLVGGTNRRGVITGQVVGFHAGLERIFWSLLVPTPAYHSYALAFWV